MCNGSSSSNLINDPTKREQELIQKLEEATYEIEALLTENEKLMKLSNGLRFDLEKSNGQPFSHENSQQQSELDHQDMTQENEQLILDAILNDQSRSCCDSESRESEVACIGRKPPMSSASDCRPSKTAYVRMLQLYLHLLCLY